MDVELTPERQERLAEAGYVPAPALDAVPVRGRIRVQDSSGSPFDLELVDLPDGAREGAIAHLSGWFSVADPGVETLVDALDLDDAIGYLTAVAAPCTLETFVEVTGRLGAGHTSTLLVTLGRALARLHARGLRYGPIRPQDVLIDDGRVLLTVPKPALTGGAPLAPSPQEDAYHLAALADAVIAPAHGPQAGDRPEPGLRGLTRLIVSALGDADTRPGVGTLATLSHDLAPCLPLVPVRGAASVDGGPGDPGDRVHRGDLGDFDDFGDLGEGAPRVPGGVRRAGLDRPPPRRTAFRGRTPGGAGAGRAGSAGAGSPGAGRAGEMPGRAGQDGAGRERAGRGVPGPERRRVRGVTVAVVVAMLAGLAGGGAVVHHWGTGAPAQAAPGETASVEVTPAEVAGTAGEVEDDPGAAAARLTSARMDAVVALTNAPETGTAVPGADGSGDASGDAAGAAAGAAAGDVVGEAVSDGWADVLVPGSPAHLQAVELVSSLRAGGARITGLTVETDAVVVLAQVAASASAPATAQVQVTFTIGAYTVETSAGSQAIPAGAPRTAVLDLVSTDSGWRVAAVHELAPAD